MAKSGTSKYVGVHFSSKRQKWIASITVDNYKGEIGSFDDEEEAAKAYDRRAFRLGRKTNILKFRPVN